MQQNYVFREEMNLYRIVLASLLPFCQAWRVEVEPFENIPMYSKQNLTFKLEMENGMIYTSVTPPSAQLNNNVDSFNQYIGCVL